MSCVCLLNVSVGKGLSVVIIRFCDMFRPETTANLGREECQLVVAAELKIVR